LCDDQFSRLDLIGHADLKNFLLAVWMTAVNALIRSSLAGETVVAEGRVGHGLVNHALSGMRALPGFDALSTGSLTHHRAMSESLGTSTLCRKEKLSLTLDETQCVSSTGSRFV